MVAKEYRLYQPVYLDLSTYRQNSGTTFTKIFSAESPYDITVINDVVLVADGSHGLAIYKVGGDLPNAGTIEPVSSLEESAYGLTLIPYRNVVAITGKDGLYQYDISDPDRPRQLSFLGY